MAEAVEIDLDAQKREITTLLEIPLRKDDIWCLVDVKWYRRWKKFVGMDSFVDNESVHPGPIDNRSLLKDESSGQLREGLTDEIDYVVIPQRAWQKLVEWYKTVDGQDPIQRKVIVKGDVLHEFVVEVYPLELKLSLMESDKSATCEFSASDTTEKAEAKVRQLFDIAVNREIRLWMKFSGNTFEKLEQGKSLQEAGAYRGLTVIVEQMSADGTWPRQSKTTSSTASTAVPYNYNSPSGSSMSTRSNTYGGSYYAGSGSGGHESYAMFTPGLCGLQNLGNTCFMNSALQCMSNVPPLTEFFLSDQWRKELNEDNPLGMNGRIAISFAELMHVMWSGKHSSAVPRQFKHAVGSFAPQFSGYNQHDAQELMAFLLDGLHEDLNRIRKKPYIEMKEEDGLSDDETAKKSWDMYVKRNDSIIVDKFHGQLKSTLVCPDCKKVSVTFDPFCYLSLPLPTKKERQLELVFIPIGPAKPVKYKVTVPKQGYCKDLYAALERLTGVSQTRMLATEVYNSHFHKIFNNLDESIANISERDEIVVYELPERDKDNYICLPLYLREQKYSAYANYSSHSVFGTPTFAFVPAECSYKQLYMAIVQRFGNRIRPITKDRLQQLQKSADDGADDEEEEKADRSSKQEAAEGENGASLPMEQDDSVDAARGTDKSSDTPAIFSLMFVNSYGSTDFSEVKDNGDLIKFDNASYLAVDWSHKARAIFYDSSADSDFDNDDSMNEKVTQKKQSVQLTECLDLFTTVEKLGEQDPWYCPRCKEHKQATKKFDLWQLPEVLVIHMKRFSYTRYWRDKIDSLIEFPTRKLDMTPWLINKKHGPATYDLIAVCNHYGGLGGGHYTAFAKNQVDNSWYHFDDSSVSKTREDQVVTKASYVLVYHRRGDATIAPSLRSAQQHNNHSANNNADNEEDMDSS